LSVLSIQFRDRGSLQADRWRVAQRLAVVRLPPGVSAPRLTPLSSSTGTVLIVALTAPHRSLMRLHTIARWQVLPQIMAVPGVSDVLVYGGRPRALQVQVRPRDMLRLGVDLDQVRAAAARATGMLGAGFIDTSQQRLLLQTDGLRAGADALAAAVLRSTPQGSLTLGDVADVRFAPLPAVGAASLRGQPGVLLVVGAQYGANTLRVTQGVQRALARLRPTLLEQGVVLHHASFRPADFIHLAMHNVTSSLLLGGVLVVLVILLALLDWRAALVSSLAIPMSLLTAVAVLTAMGVSLNVMTLGGLAIAIGVVVDDAVIDVENVLRRLRANRALPRPLPDLQVVLAACLEVRAAVVYATAAVLLVVVPVLLMPGLAGRLFSPLAQAYALAVLASLLVALTVTPALCALLLVRDRAASHLPAPVRFTQRHYMRVQQRLLTHWKPALGLSVVLVAAGAWAASSIGGSFLPPLQEGQFVVHMHLAPGASLQASLDMGARVEAALQRLPEVRVVAQHVGRAGLSPDAAGTESSEIEVTLRDGVDSSRALRRIQRVLAGFAGATFRINSFFGERLDETLAGGGSAPLVIDVSANHLRVIAATAQQVARVVAGLPTATGVQVASPPGVPQLRLRLREQALRRWGLSALGVLRAVHTAVAGSEVGTVYRGAVPVPVRVVLQASQRDNPAVLGELPVRTPHDGFVPLRELVEMRLVSAPGRIEHIDGQRTQQVLAATTSPDLSGFVRHAEQVVRGRLRLPPGVVLSFHGEAEQRANSLRRVASDSVLVVAALVLLLAMALRSARHVLLVLAALPVAWAGGMIAVWLVGGVFSIGVAVGLLALMGISLRNAILVFAHARQLVREQGLAWDAATVLRAVCDRLAPIVMTTLVTGLGVLPLALGMHAPGREIEGPMAVVLLGGLLSSLGFNLFVLPQLALRFGHAAAA
ncbi:MAG: efflux RND transporter permease subunit, partial [Betaproteobacteria bacterium]|nr:efflux RND transporter permease subunit [Betaproteobacteria bacterium]